MKVIEETVKKYQAEDGTKFDTKHDCLNYEEAAKYSSYYIKIDRAVEFDVTEEHLKLVKRCNIDWMFLGQDPSIGNFYQDTKRPYGNSDFLMDIVEILGIEPEHFDEKDPDEKWLSKDQEYYCFCRNIDMKVVMQILCSNLSIRAGRYERKPYTRTWSFCPNP